jgi:hypothetical protein
MDHSEQKVRMEDKYGRTKKRFVPSMANDNNVFDDMLSAFGIRRKSFYH